LSFLAFPAFFLSDIGWLKEWRPDWLGLSSIAAAIRAAFK
jgi:hypothetical protein